MYSYYPNFIYLVNSQIFTICRELVRLLGGAVAGIHGMVDEHFGICVVEYMAAGAIPIGKRYSTLLWAIFTSLGSTKGRKK